MTVSRIVTGLVPLLAILAARVATAAATAATEQDPFYEILEHWPGHFKGNFCITAPQELYGWKLRLKFEAPVSQIQINRMRILGHNADKTIWRLADEGHNFVWKEGERRCWDFIATRQGLTSGLEAEAMFVQLPERQDCPEQVQGQRFALTIANEWRNGLSGRFCLRVPRDSQGWKIRVEFGADAKGIITGLQVPEAGRVTNVEDRRVTWLLSPRNYNRVLSEGQTFCLAFTRTSRRWVRPCMRAFFTESDGETPIEVTLPPTTTPPETTQRPETTQVSSSAGTTEAPTPAPTTTTLPETTQRSSSAATTEAPTTTEPMSTPEYGSVYSELQLWEEGVNGLLCLYHAVNITCGWEAEIVFDPAIDSIEIWRAGVAGILPYTGSGNVVHLTNLTFNFEVAENPVCLDFNAFKSYPEAPASVFGQFTRICSNDRWVDIPGGTGMTPSPPEMTTESSTGGDANTTVGVMA